jgi:hypothetical protein
MVAGLQVPSPMHACVRACVQTHCGAEFRRDATCFPALLFLGRIAWPHLRAVLPPCPASSPRPPWLRRPVRSIGDSSSSPFGYG